MHASRLSRLLPQKSLALAVLGLLPIAAEAQSLISRYTLDGTGDDTGSLNIDGTLFGTGAFTTGGGVGAGNFNNSLSVGPAAGYLTAATANNAAFGLGAITIALWVNVDTAAANDRFVSNLTTTSGFDFSIFSYSAGTGAGGADSFNIGFGFNSTSGAVQNVSAKYVSDKWLFLAVTYDSSLASNQVSFFSGDETAGVTLNGTGSKTGSIAASSQALRIGSTPASGADRTPTALFNDVRIYAGALNPAQLEAIRASAIPEPSSYAAVAGLAALGGVFLRRRRVAR